MAFTLNRSNFSAPSTISIGHAGHSKEIAAQQEYILTTFGKQLATMLAEILRQLTIYNKEAIYPILSVIEPFMETEQNQNIAIPPRSSREVTIEITREGRVTPKIYLDESL